MDVQLKPDVLRSSLGNIKCSHGSAIAVFRRRSMGLAFEASRCREACEEFMPAVETKDRSMCLVSCGNLVVKREDDVSGGLELFPKIKSL